MGYAMPQLIQWWVEETKEKFSLSILPCPVPGAFGKLETSCEPLSPAWAPHNSYSIDILLWGNRD